MSNVIYIKGLLPLCKTEREMFFRRFFSEQTSSPVGLCDAPAWFYANFHGHPFLKSLNFWASGDKKITRVYFTFSSTKRGCSAIRFVDKVYFDSGYKDIFVKLIARTYKLSDLSCWDRNMFISNSVRVRLMQFSADFYHQLNLSKRAL